MNQSRNVADTSSHRDRAAERHSPNHTILRELQISGYSELKAVRCECDENRVILIGVLPSFYLKQLTQTFARNAAGHLQIVNRIEVRYKEVATC